MAVSKDKTRISVSISNELLEIIKKVSDKHKRTVSGEIEYYIDTVLRKELEEEQ